MKILSSSPYATFDLKEWNALVSKNDRFVNTPIEVKKKDFRTFTFKKTAKTKIILEKNKLHKQMQLILG